MQYESYDSLHNTIADAWNGAHDIERFRKQLRKFTNLICKPQELVSTDKNKNMNNTY
jgi:hypothetical protein